MLPIQVLLNNLLYDVSEIAIPFDRVDPQATARPVKWDIKLIERSMLVFGPLSSVFDFLTFYALLHLFGAGEALFQTGWLIELITTQVLVDFAIRTRRRFFRSRPHRLLVAMALGSVTVAVVFPLLPAGRWFDFVTPPPLFFVFLVGATAAYLGSSKSPRASSTAGQPHGESADRFRANSLPLLSLADRVGLTYPNSPDRPHWLVASRYAGATWLPCREQIKLAGLGDTSCGRSFALCPAEERCLRRAFPGGTVRTISRSRPAV